jgi:hypothetical protein
MFGLLGNTVRRISDQYQGAPRDPLGDLDEQEESSPPPPADEEEEAVSESKNEDVEQEQAQQDAYAAEMHRLRLEIDALKRSNAVLRQQQSQRSSASAQPVATSHSSKFVRVYDVPDSALLETQVSLSKAAYGKPGSSDYRKNKLMATAPLREKFGVARHKVTTDLEEGDQDKSMHVQQVIVSVVHRVKEGHERSKAMDWMSVCTMPHLIAVNKSQDPSTWWDSSEICIWTDPELLFVEEVRVWQYCINKRFSDEDCIASLWLKDFVHASSTDALKTAVMKKYDKLPDNQRGGAVYLYLTLMEMFQMSREVKDAMLTFIGLFKRKGIARYAGENVLLASEEIMGVCKRLDAGKGLLDEHVIDILTGLAISSNPRFRKMFDHLKQCADLGNLDFLDTIAASDPPLVKIKAIMEKAVDVYDKLCVAGH